MEMTTAEPAVDVRAIREKIKLLTEEKEAAEKEIVILEQFADQIKSSAAKDEETLETLRLGLKSIDELMKKVDGLAASISKLEGQLPKPKWDPLSHPLYAKKAEEALALQKHEFVVGEQVDAKWTDGRWYPAKIMTTLGSSLNPRFLVHFTGYDDSKRTVSRDEIRVRATNANKRKALEALEAATLTEGKHVVAAPSSAAILAKANTAPTVDSKEVAAAPAKKRKRGNPAKNLYENKNRWDKWISSTKGKAVHSTASQFRTKDANVDRFEPKKPVVRERYRFERAPENDDNDEEE